MNAREVRRADRVSRRACCRLVAMSRPSLSRAPGAGQRDMRLQGVRARDEVEVRCPAETLYPGLELRSASSSKTSAISRLGRASTGCTQLTSRERVRHCFGPILTRVPEAYHTFRLLVLSPVGLHRRNTLRLGEQLKPPFHSVFSRRGIPHLKPYALFVSDIPYGSARGTRAPFPSDRPKPSGAP